MFWRERTGVRNRARRVRAGRRRRIVVGGVAGLGGVAGNFVLEVFGRLLGDGIWRVGDFLYVSLQFGKTPLDARDLDMINNKGCISTNCGEWKLNASCTVK
jgi:hypothetical protein